MTERLKIGIFALTTIALASFVGCDSGPTLYSVSGTVTFDGKPIPQGDIIFHSTDPDGHPYSAKIVDGKFSGKVEPGLKRVAITAMRNHPTKTKQGIEPGTTEPVVEQYIPAEYNVETTLTQEIMPGSNDLQLNL
ncbi:MAG: hypothetical protein NXI22_18565 [bacterium]|nr:hypothetical protein [bacterium]